MQRWNLTEDQASGEYRGVPTRNPVVRFTSDGALVAVATGDDIRILDVVTGQMLQVIVAAGSTISDVSWVPQKHMLLVGTDMGRTRIWGRPDEGKAFGLSPLHAPIVVANANSSESATVGENLAIIDLRLLPKLPGAKPQSDSFHAVNYSAPVDIEEVKAFYRYKLGERGWNELSDQATPYTIPFQKQGFTLIISPYGAKPMETMVSISWSGSYELRKTPTLDQFPKETIYEGDTNIIYKVKASLLQIETELLKKLHKAGWTAVARLNRSQSEQPETRDFEFVRNATVLRVSVQRDKDDAKQFVVSYGLSLSLHSLPVPSDAGLMEWDDYLESQMVANTSLSLQEATTFYEDAMKKQGWVPREKGHRIDNDVVYLPYFWGQQDVTIALEPIADGLVRIRAGKYSSSSWQKPTGSTTEAESSPAEGIEAADLPILHAAGAPTYESREVRIELDLKKNRTERVVEGVQ